MSENLNHSYDFKKKMDHNKPNSLSTPNIFVTPKIKSGINAVQVNSAREMVQLHTQGRFPTTQHRSNLLAKKSAFIGKNLATNKKESKCKNPQCDCCGQVIIPSPQSSFPIQDTPSISVNDWEIYTIKKPILNSQELDDLSDKRFDFPLPEMIFGNNSVRLYNKKTQEEIVFNALDALDSLENDCEFKVSYHKEWLQSRKSQKPIIKSESLNKKDLSEFTDKLDNLKPFDWTYSPNYKGTTRTVKFTTRDDLEIPIERLTVPDPILFFDESVLYEDELADNGISIYSTKIRVMPTCLLLLCRFFLRIDNVIFRVRDTRIFIDFQTNQIIREHKEQEMEYEDLLVKHAAKLNSNDPKKLLRDSNWIAQNIPVKSRTVETNLDEHAGN